MIDFSSEKKYDFSDITVETAFFVEFHLFLSTLNGTYSMASYEKDRRKLKEVENNNTIETETKRIKGDCRGYVHHSSGNEKWKAGKASFSIRSFVRSELNPSDIVKR